MNKEFVPYRLSLKLKELGFKDKCFGFYYNKKLILIHELAPVVGEDIIDAPLWQQVFDWFRINHNLLSFIDIDNSYRIYGGNVNDGYNSEWDIDSIPFKTYEDARLECLKKLLTLC